MSFWPTSATVFGVSTPQGGAYRLAGSYRDVIGGFPPAIKSISKQCECPTMIPGYAGKNSVEALPMCRCTEGSSSRVEPHAGFILGVAATCVQGTLS